MKLSPWAYLTLILLTKLSAQMIKAKDLILNDDITLKSLYLLDFPLVLSLFEFSMCHNYMKEGMTINKGP